MRRKFYSRKLLYLAAVGFGVSTAQGETGSLEATLRAIECSPDGGGGDYSCSIAYGGKVRTYQLHVPRRHDLEQRAPLVLNFHGGMGNTVEHERKTRFKPKSDREGFFLVAPQGSSRGGGGAVGTWNAGSCCGFAERNQIDDVGFVGKILDRLASALKVDQQRVYATGFSNGAMFSHRLGCELSERIAAIAPVGGGLNDVDLSARTPRRIFSCSPKRAVPVLQIHGLADQCYPWNGGASEGISGESYVSIPATIDGWAKRNGCVGEAKPSYAKGDAICNRYAQCHHGATVIACQVRGHGHVWPGAAIYPSKRRCGGELSADLSATDFIWDFFQANPMLESAGTNK
jgi:polyhydroxybutyrate depolymerase